MSARQIAFPFERTGARKTNPGFASLIGQSYAEDAHVTATVIGICESNPSRLFVRRQPGGVITLPGWLVCTILRYEGGKKVLAA